MDTSANTAGTQGKWPRVVAIVCLYLLALLWSVAPFFLWLFTGLAFYFEFLYRFYQYRAAPRESEWHRPNVRASAQGIDFPKMGRLVPVVAGVVVFTIVATLIYSFAQNGDASDGTADATETDSTDQDTSDPHLDSWTDKGNGFYNRGAYDSAMFYYRRVLRADPDNKSGLYNTALVMYSQNEYIKPVPLLRKCLDQNPDYGEGDWLLGDIYLARNLADSARFWFEQAYQNGVRDGKFLQLLASSYENDDRGKAIQFYRESVARDSTLVDSYRKLMQLDPERADEYQRRLSASR